MEKDEELLERWREGDAAAADELILRHFDSLCRFFRNKVGDVEDLVQQTLLTMVERRDRFPEAWAFRTRLFVAARDHLYMHYRKQGRVGKDFDAGVTSLRDIGPSPSTMLAHGDRRRVVLEALSHLPLDLQIALELYYWEDLSAPELSKVLEVPEGTVRSRLRRAKTLLSEELERRAQAAGQGSRISSNSGNH